MQIRNILYIVLVSLLCNGISNAQTWKEVGPLVFPTNSSGQINGFGRVTQIKFHPSLANVMYATSASGGAYTTIDTGHHWTLLNTDNFAVSNMSCICIDNTNDQILYLGTGDPNYYSTDFSIYKSTNGGATWAAANTGIATLLPIEIIMHPTNNQQLITATNNGIWQTLNGATTWTNVKSGGAFTDMQRIPNTNTLIAVTGAQVWRSTDFGATWTQNTSATFSQSGTDGMRICTNPTSNNIVYVVSNGNNGVVFRSTDYGVTFTNIYSSTTQCLVCYDENPANAGQGNYDFAACADPSNANHLYIAAHCLWESNDSGYTWQRKTAWPKELHTDHHQFVFSPYDNTKFWSANDGGIWLREGWNDSLWMPMCDGVTATEIYHAANSPVVRKLASIGTQDNGEEYYDNTGWYTNRGGDWGSRMEFDYNADNSVYYLENGERRPFTPQSGSNSYNSPFAETNNSRIAFDADNKDLALLAKDTIWMSTNLSTTTPTWTAIAPNNNAIRDIAISTANNNTAYSIHSGKFLRIENLNSSPTVTSTTPPSAAGTRGSVATVKQKDSVVYLSCNAKMYRSSNKGASWTNITYNLPNVNILKIYHDDYSNNETVFICSGNQIFRKTLADTTWTNISNNLPKIANITDFMIMNDSTVASKLRVAYYGRGVWEYPLHPSYLPIADFSTANTIICNGNSVTFDNQSVDDSLTYSWTCTGGTPSTSALKNPTITYNTPGIYPVSLTATNNYGSNTKTWTNYIEVLNGAPLVDNAPGKAMELNGATNSIANAGVMNLNTNHATLMCWIKPQGTQNDWAGLIFCRGAGTTSGMSIKSDNEIRYHWNDQNYWFSTGLYAPSGEWSHCALVVTPDSATIYVNGIGSSDVGANAISTFNANLMIGVDPNGGGRLYKGMIDEVAVYNRALSQAEIREQMHLTKKNNVAADSLKGYWQMNAVTANNTILNKANCTNQLAISAGCNFVNSTAPMGGGTSQRINAIAGGVLNCSNADLSIKLPNAGPYPDGEICVSHIIHSPDEMPNGANPAEDYYILDNYGGNKNINALTALQMSNCGQINGTAAQHTLYSRKANDFGSTWGAAIGNATSIVTGANGSIDFNPAQNITTLGQFVVAGPYWALPIADVKKDAAVEVYPNPTRDILFIKNRNQAELYITLYAIDGKIVYQNKLDATITAIPCKEWSSGIYFYKVESATGSFAGKVEVRE